MTPRAAGWGAAAVIAAAIVAYDPRAPAADPKRAVGLLVVVVALAAAVARPAREGGRAIPPAARALVAFVAWSGLSLAWGAPSGARDLGAWVAAAGLAVAARRWPARWVAGRAAALAGSAASAIAVAERLSGARGVLVHGGQGNANWLGLLLAITLPLTIDLLAGGRRGARAATAAAVAIQLAGLVLSHSRVAWAAAAIALTCLALALARGTRGRALVIAGALAIAALGLRASVEAGAPAASVAEGADVPVPVAWSGRVWIWRSSGDAAAAALPLGAGLGGFAQAYLDAQGRRLAALDPGAASRRFLNATTAHSDWIEVLVDSGLPGLALLALAVAWGALAAARGGWPAGAAALLAFSVCAAGDSPLRQPGVAMVIGLVLAGCEARAPAPERVEPALRAALLGAAALLLAASVGGWIAARRLTAAKEALPAERRALLASAARLDPWSGEIALERGLLDLASGDAEGALVALRRSRRLLANVGTDVAIGNAEALLGRPGAALDAYEAALLRHPGSFKAHANATEACVALGRLDEADRHLAIASALWPGNPRLGPIGERVREARIDRATAP